MKKYLIWAIFLLFICFSANAQMLDPGTDFFFVKIDSIVISGNKITRKALILRELDISKGDSVPSRTLTSTLERNRLRVINLGIFLFVSVEAVQGDDPQHAYLKIKVNEGWYWYPSPVFELADRNFNVWWKEFHHSFKRVNYGLDYTQKNVTGHADELNLTAVRGYNQRFNARYRTPALNKKQTLGIQLGASYSRTGEVAIKTVNNKLVFFSEPLGFAVRRLQLDAGISWRPGLLHTHTFALEHRKTTIADTIANELNPLFFVNGGTSQRHHSFIYNYHFDNRNVRAYPTKGWEIYLEARQNGLLPSDDINLLRLKTEVTKFTPLAKWLSVETAVRLRVSLPRNRPPYFNNQALGYGNDLVRGYEYFVMDGLDFGVLKTSLRARFLDHTFTYPAIIKKYWSRTTPIPVQLYLSFQNDVGYSNDPWFAAENPYTNRWLYACGVGLDIVLFYKIAAQVAWMHTATGENGFFVRTRL